MVDHVEHFGSNFVSVHFTTNFINNYNLEYQMDNVNLYLFIFDIKENKIIWINDRSLVAGTLS